MSQFLPETGAGGPQTDSVGSLLTPATLDISSGDIALMQKVLAAAARNPNLIPSDFMAYIVDYIQTSRLQIPIGQVFGIQKLTTITGVIPAAGTTPTSGTGFSYTHPLAGNYHFTFTTPFSTPPLIYCAADEDADLFFRISSRSISGFNVRVDDISGIQSDHAFTFVVITLS